MRSQGAGVDPIAFAIPVFMLLIGIEIWWAKRSGQLEVYRFSDSIADLSCGVMSQVLKVFIVTFTAAGYIWVHENVGQFALSESDPWVWLGTFFAVDFCYYWFHRLSHQINFLWAAHVVHHQSEEYNLTVALRQSVLQPGFSWVFYLPLAVIGVPPFVFFVLASINTLYQFWIHTRLIGRLGPFELFFNTPSHHRVHHGQNPRYIDRNHAGTLIIWDRIFGTFEPEGEPVIYGVTEPTRSWNPLWANIHTWWFTAGQIAKVPGLGNKLRLFIEGPGWLPPAVSTAKADKSWPPPKYEPRSTRGLKIYVFFQFLPILLIMPAFLMVAVRVDPALKAALGASILLGLMTLNGLLDGREWAPRFEQVRLPLTALALGLGWPAAWPYLMVALAGLGLASVLTVVGLRRTELSVEP